MQASEAAQHAEIELLFDRISWSVLITSTDEFESALLAKLLLSDQIALLRYVSDSRKRRRKPPCPDALGECLLAPEALLDLIHDLITDVVEA